MGAALTLWPSERDPNDAALEAIFRDKGLRPSWWSNGPGDRYAAHAHPYHKVLYCAQGGVRFDLPASGECFSCAPATGSTFRRARSTRRWSALKV